MSIWALPVRLPVDWLSNRLGIAGIASRVGDHFVGGEALQYGEASITLRYRDRKVQVSDGHYAETKEQIGGILILEADTWNTQLL